MKRLIFCEPCCGSAAVTIRLLQRYGKPPISYMGGKSGYADVILDALGLVPGQGCDGIVLADVGPWAAVWATLGNAMPPEDAARWLHANALSMVKNGTAAGYSRVNGEGNDFTDRHGAEGHWHATTPDVSATRIEACNLPASKAVANIIRQWKDEEPRALWDRLKAEGWPSLLLPKGEVGRWLGPQSVEEVARWTWVTGHGDFSQTPRLAAPYQKPEGNADGSWKAPPRDWLVGRVESMPTFPPLACYQGSANEMLLPDDLTGWIVYLDGPYDGTSGYPFGTFSRSQQVEFALKCHNSGAIVAISEAVRLDGALGDEWFAIQIDHARKGAKRTFSKQQDEWLTMNRPPANVPAKQVGLFA